MNHEPLHETPMLVSGPTEGDVSPALTPFAWGFCLNGAEPDRQRALLSRHEPTAYEHRFPLYTGEAMQAAIQADWAQRVSQDSASKAVTKYVSDFIAANGCYPTLEQAFEAGRAHGANEPDVDALCARIKAADDASSDNGYMLDSDDCIKVLRGEWPGTDQASVTQAPACQAEGSLVNDEIGDHGRDPVYPPLPPYIYGRETGPNERVYMDRDMFRFADATYAMRRDSQRQPCGVKNAGAQ